MYCGSATSLRIKEHVEKVGHGVVAGHREAQIDHFRRVAAECGPGVGIRGRRAVGIKVWRHHRRQSALRIPCHVLPWPSDADDDAAIGVFHTHDEAVGS